MNDKDHAPTGASHEWMGRLGGIREGSSARRSYGSPCLVVYGSLVDLTRQEGKGNDVFDGFIASGNVT